MLNVWVYKPNKSLSAEKDLFVLVAGPGGLAFNKAHIAKINETLKQAGIETLLIGDGNNPVTEDITAKLAMYKNCRHMTIMMVAHGYRTENNEHILWLGETANTRTKDMIFAVSKMRKEKSTDFILTSSYGSAILPQIYKKLSKKSRVTVLSPDEHLVTGEQLTAMIEQLCHSLPSAFSGTESFNSYLCCMQNKMAPQFAIARKGLFKPQELLANRLGKPFSVDEKIAIQKKLGDALPPERLQEMEKTIEKARNESEIPAKDFGVALAMCNVIAEKNRKGILASLF